MIDYLAWYTMRVASTNADGTLELISLHPGAPSLSAVPVRLDPGASTKPDAGADVLVGFDNGSPAAPFATLPGGPMREVTITAEKKISVRVPDLELGPDGTRQPVARDGDVVTVPLVLTLPEGALAGMAPAGEVVSTGLVLSDPIVGTIEATATKTKAA